MKNDVALNSSAVDLCRLCGGNASFAFEGRLIGRSVRYFDCPDCGYLQTETPTWLDKAYTTPISIFDTGLFQRNLHNAKLVSAMCLLSGLKDARIVDFAGGHGVLVRMLRDIGFDALWDDKYCDNIFAQGFEYDGGKVDVATAFEAFEHFVEPTKELDRLLEAAPVVVFSTLLLPEPIPKPGSWSYYGTEHGQHIGFYRRRTLEKMAAMHKATFTTNESDIHVISRAPYHVEPSGTSLRMTIRAWPLVRRFYFKSRTLSDQAKVISERSLSISNEESV